MGWEVYTNDTLGHRAFADLHEQLAVALAQGLTGPRAIASAIDLHRQQSDSAATVRAAQAQADATTALARAIEHASQDAAIRAVLGRLTESTQYAVRSQLGMR
jgi:hypothetical protein